MDQYDSKAFLESFYKAMKMETKDIDDVVTNSEDASMPEKPVVVILNGAGGNGKDLFMEIVEMTMKKTCKYCNSPVRKMSSIDPIRDVARQLIAVSDSQRFEGYRDPTEMRKNAIEEAIKTAQYRTWLSEMKTSWIKYNNGAFQYTVNKVLSAKRCALVYFCVIREPMEINKLTDWCKENEYNVITVLIDGMHKPIEYDNDSDRNVDMYEYDYGIINEPGQYGRFVYQATVFAIAMQRVIEGLV